jgi:16S rRNA (adenine1518-N6/adenine1519-N6)-dimethyltransferase
MRDYRVIPKKRLGQNFMIDGRYLDLIVSNAELIRSDVVLEVGAGFGFLTRLLAQKAGKVVAVEVDGRLMKALLTELADLDNVELIEGDVFEVSLPVFNKMISNPPFSVSSRLLFWLLKRPLECAFLTFQEEFARRLEAQVGSRDYSRLTVSTYYHADVETLVKIPREAFYPLPDVDSALVRLRPRRPPPFKVKDEKTFDEVVRTLFTQRNRKVRKAILPFLRKQGLSEAGALEKADSLPFKGRRVRELPPEDFGVLANELS